MDITMFWIIVYFVCGVSVTTGLVCPSSWTENTFHNSCVKLVATKRTWFLARQACAAEGSTLVHVDSKEMYDMITTMTGSSFVWLSTNDLVEEGVFRGVGGQLMTFLYWNPIQDEPSDAHQGAPHTQNALALKDPEMHDKGTGSTMNYVCEKWYEDVQTASFTKMSMDFLESSHVGFDSTNNFRISTDRKHACAGECRKQRPLCDAFVFNRATKDCYSLRLYDTGNAEVLSSAQRTVIQNTGASVYIMTGR